MMSAVYGLLSFVTDHAVATLLIFLATTSALIVVLSGQQSGRAVQGLFEVLWSIVTTPFRFLRKVLEMMKTREASETPYVDSREHISFRANRIQYVFVFLTALLLLSGGLAASIVALYPKPELERRASLGEDLKELDDEIKAQESIIAAAAKPDYKETLKARVQAAKVESDKSSVQLRRFIAEAPYSGGWLEQMEGARDVDAAIEVAGQLDDVFEGCPDNSSEFDSEDCVVFQKHARELAKLKIADLKAAQTYAEARGALEAADAAADDAKSKMSELQDRRAEVKEEFDASSLLSFGWVKTHIGAALAIFLPTLATVIAYVWVGAILADVIGWLIMMMLALERRFSDDGRGDSVVSIDAIPADHPTQPVDPIPADDSPRDLRRPWHST